MTHRQALAVFGTLALTSLSACSTASEEPGSSAIGPSGNGAGSGGTGSGGTGSGGLSASGGAPDVDLDGGTDIPPDDSKNVGPQQPELWYSSGPLLVYIEMDRETGAAVRYEASKAEGMPLGQTAITMLHDGSLLIARLTGKGTELFHIQDPPRDGSDATVVPIGKMIDNIGIEGLYTDCLGRLYAMDTGVDDTSADGNRLLLFTGNVLAGELSYLQISDLSTADVADIDDMGPGIKQNGELSDNPGLAIDTGEIYTFNYETGSGARAASGGQFGIHALGGSLFADGRSRAYVLDGDATLYELVVGTWQLSKPLIVGPDPRDGKFRAHSGMTGPLSNCETGFTYDVR
jgi:hypothetical protein